MKTESTTLHEARPAFLRSLEEYQAAATGLASFAEMLLDDTLPGIAIPTPLATAIGDALERFRKAE